MMGCHGTTRKTDRADELQGRHTLFGRINGPTIYSTPLYLEPVSQSVIQLLMLPFLVTDILKIGNLELDKSERPLFPPKIISCRIVENPFTDIVPRITPEERKAQAEAKLRIKEERDAALKKKGAKKSVVVPCKPLLTLALLLIALRVRSETQSS